jgi:hypothetical protein
MRMMFAMLLYMSTQDWFSWLYELHPLNRAYTPKMRKTRIQIPKPSKPLLFTFQGFTPHFGLLVTLAETRERIKG